MHVCQRPYRELFDNIVSYDGSGLGEDLINPWVRAQASERVWFEEFARRRGNPPIAGPEDLWRLYAMSRLSDLLLLSFAPWGADHPDTWQVARVAPLEYREFMESFGFTRAERPAFHPFFHEVTRVDQAADPAAPLRIEAELWPTFFLGPLLFSRSGCRVSGGHDQVVKEVAEGSTLYWAFARHHRPTHDLSKGWGSNSQWRTAFRRDYALDGGLHYNVDARPDDDESSDGDLSSDEKLELLRHRCFIRCAKAHDDRYPYHYRHVEE